MTEQTDSLHEQHNLWTISNMLSVSRVVLTIPITLLLFQEGDTARWWVLVLILIAMSTDSLDGKLARMRNEVSEEGKLLDPLADKIAVGIIVFVLALTGELQWWFVSVILGRDLLIILAGIYIKTQYGFVFPSNQLGKWAVTIIAITIFVVLLPFDGLEVLETALIALSMLFLTASTVSYIIRFLNAGKVAKSLEM
jgi:cardiolipin synthase (CMP-forming)